MDVKTIINWYLSVLKKYAAFSGRAGRAEYWSFMLVSLLIGIGLGMIGGRGYGMMGGWGYGGGGLSSLYSLLILIPSIAVGMRRLHDIGKSGWWLLISLIPLLGFLVLLFFAVQEGDSGANSFGSKARTEPEKVLKF